LFAHLRQRWQDLFAAQFDVLLYDLTSTYVEGEGQQIPKASYAQQDPAIRKEMAGAALTEGARIGGSKIIRRQGELYVLVKSEGRRAKERAMRRKKLARLLRKLRTMRRSGPRRDQL